MLILGSSSTRASSFQVRFKHYGWMDTSQLSTNQITCCFVDKKESVSTSLLHTHSILTFSFQMNAFFLRLIEVSEQNHREFPLQVKFFRGTPIPSLFPPPPHFSGQDKNSASAIRLTVLFYNGNTCICQELDLSDKKHIPATDSCKCKMSPFNQENKSF